MMFLTTLTEIGIGVVICLILWTSFYFILRHVGSETKAEWHCRVVTMIHAISVTLLTGYCGFIDGPWPFTDPGGPNTQWQLISIVVCLGYFIFDLTWCLYHKTEGPVMLLHHLLSIFGMTMTLVVGKYGTELIASIFGSEITNPFLQLRWFIKETGNYNTWYAELNDIFFMSLFGFMRIGIGTYLLYTYFNHPRPDFLGKLGAISLYSISWVFWIGICQYALRKYKKKFKAMRLNSNEGKSEKACKDSVQNGHAHFDGPKSSGVSSDSVQVPSMTNGTALKSKTD